MKVHYPKLYNMAHLFALNDLLLTKDPTIIFIFFIFLLHILYNQFRHDTSQDLERYK